MVSLLPKSVFQDLKFEMLEFAFLVQLQENLYTPLEIWITSEVVGLCSCEENGNEKAIWILV